MIAQSQHEELDTVLAPINEVLRGTIQVGGWPGDDGEEAYVYVTADNPSRPDGPYLRFNAGWGELLEEDGPDVQAVVVRHLKRVLDEHERNLAEVTKRLRVAGLLPDESIQEVQS